MAQHLSVHVNECAIRASLMCPDLRSACYIALVRSKGFECSRKQKHLSFPLTQLTDQTMLGITVLHDSVRKLQKPESTRDFGLESTP